MLRGLLLLWSMGSGRRGVRSCGSQAQLPHNMRDLPGPGIKESVPPVSAGGFSATEPPGKPLSNFRFTEELQKQDREFLHTLHPDSSNVNILYNDAILSELRN